MNDEMHTKKRKSFSTDRSILGEIYPLRSPFTVIVDASEICNFKCNYCFRSNPCDEKSWGDYAIKKRLMEWDVYKEIVKQILEFPDMVRMVSLSNHGEPLCNRQLPNMIRYLKESGYTGRVSIHTNAALLTDEYAIDLADSGIDKIVVSLQGLSADKYKEVCGVKIDFDELVRCLKVLYNNKRENTIINIKIMDVVVGDEEDLFYEMFSPLADTVFVEKMVPIWKNIDYSKKNTMIENKYGDSFIAQQVCPLIFNTIVVTPEGDVYPCTQITSKQNLGNIKDKKLVEIWNSEKRKVLLKNQLELCSGEECTDCYIRQNSIFSEADMIDDYRGNILERLLSNTDK